MLACSCVLFSLVLVVKVRFINPFNQVEEM